MKEKELNKIYCKIGGLREVQQLLIDIALKAGFGAGICHPLNQKPIHLPDNSCFSCELENYKGPEWFLSHQIDGYYKSKGYKKVQLLTFIKLLKKYENH